MYLRAQNMVQYSLMYKEEIVPKIQCKIYKYILQKNTYKYSNDF